MLQTETTAPHPSRPLILASSSPYRRLLLERLGIAFSAHSPEVDERQLPGEMAADMALRLAEAKARRIAEAHPTALIIGSDQVAVLDERIIGKPGSHEAAVEQLLAASGKTLPFLTAVSVLDAASGRLQSDLIPTWVEFRQLDRAMVEGYLTRERPYACAGALQVERLGIVLIERIDSPDPTALIGLPLIRLSRMLEVEGVDLLGTGARQSESGIDVVKVI